MNFIALQLSFVFDISRIKIVLLKPLLNKLNWRSRNLYLYCMEFTLAAEGTLTRLFANDRDKQLPTYPFLALDLELPGIMQDRHHGFEKGAGAREKALYKRGTEIKNHRSWSALSEEELLLIEQKMGISNLDPGLIGANLMFKGIPNFTQIPPLSRLKMGDVVLVVYEENYPCHLPQPHIEEAFGGKTKVPFSKAGMGLRGLVGWVEHEGILRPETKVELFVPKFYKSLANNPWLKS